MAEDEVLKKSKPKKSSRHTSDKPDKPSSSTSGQSVSVSQFMQTDLGSLRAEAESLFTADINFGGKHTEEYRALIDKLFGIIEIACKTDVNSILSQITGLKSHLQQGFDMCCSNTKVLYTAIHESKTKPSEAVPSRPSFASVANRGVKATQRQSAPGTQLHSRPQPQPRSRETCFTFTVKPKDETFSSDETMKALKSLVNPTELQTPIVRCHPIKNGIVVGCKSEKDVAKMVKHLEDETNLTVDFDVDIQKKLCPKVKISVLPKELTDEQLMEELFALNQEVRNTCTTVEDLKKSVRTIYSGKVDKADTLKYVILECTPKVRNVLLGLQKVHISYRIVTIRDHLHLTRCFKCCGFGHTSKFCKSTVDVCSHCTGAHAFKDCTAKQAKDSVPICIHCAAENEKLKKKCAKNNKVPKLLKTDHNAMNEVCPAFKRQQKIVFERTEYGC